MPSHRNGGLILMLIFLQFLYEYQQLKCLDIEMVCRWIISILLTRHLLVVIKLLKQHINIFVVQGYQHLQRFGLFSMWKDFSKHCFWCLFCFQEDVPVERPSSGSQSEKKSKAILARTTTPGMITDQVCNPFLLSLLWEWKAGYALKTEGEYSYFQGFKPANIRPESSSIGMKFGSWTNVLFYFLMIIWLVPGYLSCYSWWNLGHFFYFWRKRLSQQ